MTAKLWGILGAGLLVVALIVGLLATRAKLAERTGERDTAEVKLAVSNASIGRLTADMARMAAEQQQLATDDAARKQASRDAMKVIDAASEVRQAAIDKLMASAEAIRPAPAVATPPACEVSQAVAEVWK